MLCSVFLPRESPHHVSSVPAVVGMLVVFELLMLVDVAANQVCAAYLAGYYNLNGGAAIQGGVVTVEDALQDLRRQQVHDALHDAAKAVSGPSLMLAALFEGLEPATLLETALKKFRCVSWDVLRKHCELLIVEGEALDYGKLS
jgi:hypothetical protein